MEVCFKKDPTKKYICNSCGTQFNWSKDSSYFGTTEQADYVFCSDSCRDKHKELFKIKKEPSYLDKLFSK